jgi:hypothetical protein
MGTWTGSAGALVEISPGGRVPNPKQGRTKAEWALEAALFGQTECSSQLRQPSPLRAPPACHHGNPSHQARCRQEARQEVQAHAV